MTPVVGDFAKPHAIEVALALITALLCLPVETRPGAARS
jgi:hypothetical protein